MTALGGMSQVFRPIPGKEGFPQTSSRGDNRNGTFRNSLTGIESTQVSCFQVWYGVSNSFQVVYEDNGGDVQSLPELCLFHHPGQVGDRGTVVYNWTGYAKSGMLHRLRQVDPSQELAHNCFQSRIFPAGERLLHQWPRSSFVRINSQVRLSPTNITGK